MDRRTFLRSSVAAVLGIAAAQYLPKAKTKAEPLVKRIGRGSFGILDNLGVRVKLRSSREECIASVMGAYDEQVTTPKVVHGTGGTIWMQGMPTAFTSLSGIWDDTEQGWLDYDDAIATFHEQDDYPICVDCDGVWSLPAGDYGPAGMYWVNSQAGQVGPRIS